MNWINKNNILQAICVFSFVIANDSPRSNESISVIDLSIYEGQGSVLLEWKIPKEIKPNVTRIFFQLSGDDDFQILTELDNNISKFLHKDCRVGYRYFYYIEVEDEFGSVYSSDRATPVFASCHVLQDSLKFNPSINNIDDLIIFEFSKQVIQLYPESPHIDLLQLLFIENKNFKNIWLEDYPINELIKAESSFTLIKDILMTNSFKDSIINLESLYSNLFFLNPNQWITQIEERISFIQERLVSLIDAYPLAIEILNNLAPIRIIGLEYIDNSRILYLYKFHPNEVNLKETMLLSRDEYFDFRQLEFEDKQLLSVTIPDHWVNVDLLFDDVIIQNYNLNIHQSVNFTLNGEIIPSKSPSDIIVKKKNENLWLNEILWNPNKNELHLEIAGVSDFDNFYSIYLNENKVWDINMNQEFKIQYLDSLFVLRNTLELPIILSFNKDLFDSTESMEIIVLDSASFGIMRFKDNSYWVNTELSSFGKTNNSNKKDSELDLLPELFVLYQNYPNPFNGSTRITFDLLDDAIVSLYVTDAKGRVHDKFLIDELLNSGTYNFNWNGEGRSTGIYFFTIQAQIGNFAPVIFSRKMIYLK